MQLCLCIQNKKQIFYPSCSLITTNIRPEIRIIASALLSFDKIRGIKAERKPKNSFWYSIIPSATKLCLVVDVPDCVAKEQDHREVPSFGENRF